MKKTILLSLLLMSSALHAQFNTFLLPASAQTASDFIPSGWDIIKQVNGDLNQDGREDAVLIAEENNAQNQYVNESLGLLTLNLNPRILVIALKNAGGAYRLESVNARLIPSEGDKENTCLTDPLAEGGVSIVQGILNISLNYWSSCGTWYSNRDTYQFRYQQNDLYLIGFDRKGYHRASGDITEYSVNYLTGKVQNTTGGNMFDDNGNRPVSKWSNLPKQNLQRFEDVTAQE